MTARLLDDASIATGLQAAPGFERLGRELCASFRFPRFRDAVRFTLRLADVADELDHHPEWRVAYRRVDVRTTTHDAGGLTALDLELARRASALAAAAGARPQGPEAAAGD